MSPGVLVLPQNSSNFIYLQVEERSTSTLTSDQPLKLKFLQHKPEVAGPMPQHTQHYSYPDVDAYTVRIQERDSDN